MKKSIVPKKNSTGMRILPAPLRDMLAGTAQRALQSHLEKIVSGQIVLVHRDERRVFGKASPPVALKAVVTVHDSAFYTDILLGGSIGAAESYMAGYWSADDLTALIRILILNREVLLGIEGGGARFTGTLHWLLEKLRKNTRKGSRTNIRAHYDLGNEFYSLFLDETMTYSCNIFEHEQATLREAAVAKYDRICRKLGLSEGDHVLEIGSGWGGFALHAAAQYGCSVTTTTISPSQYEYARECIRSSGLDRRVTLLLEDYRELKGTYDKLVSIEMIEAVGHQYVTAFFRCCSERLKKNGSMLLQCITIRDEAYDAHIRSADFIKRYIFPGSFIPCISVLMNAVAAGTDMKLFHLEDITPHYARTLRTWRERFMENIEAVQEMGYAESFIRMWEYYLCYCEAGFRERYLGDVQMILTKPLSPMDPVLPPLEEERQC